MKNAPAKRKTVTESGSDRVGITELARLVKGNRARLVQTLTLYGLERGEDRKFDRAAALKAIDAHKNHDIVVGLAAARGTGTPASSLAEQKAKSEELRARRLEILIEKEERRLIPRAAVEQSAEKFIATLRAAIDAVATRAAPRLIGVKNEAVAAEIIKAETDAALAYSARMLEALADG